MFNLCWRKYAWDSVMPYDTWNNKAKIFRNHAVGICIFQKGTNSVMKYMLPWHVTKNSVVRRKN